LPAEASKGTHTTHIQIMEHSQRYSQTNSDEFGNLKVDLGSGKQSEVESQKAPVKIVKNFTY
jgi:hypothetical protein